MKSILKKSALAVIAAFAMVSCVKDELKPVETEKSLHFVINTAENSQLKSFVENNLDGTYTPKWSNGDELAIFVGDITSSTSAPTATLSNQNEEGPIAKFDGTVTTDLVEGTLLSFSPAGTFATGYTDGTVGINLSEIQNPSSLTIDEACDVLVAKPYDFRADNGTVKIDELFFKRIFSIVKVNLKGVDALNNEKVTSFTLNAPVTLTGRAAVDLSTASFSKWNVKNQSVTAKYTTDTPVFGGINGLENTVWFVVNPTAVASGSTVTFSGETENYTFSKEVTLSKELVFPQSQIAVINLTIGEGNYTEKPKATSYTLVEDASKIADGAEYLIVYNGEVAMGDFNSNNYYGKVSVKPVNKVIDITSETVNVITLEAGTTDGQYYLIDSEGYYLYYSGSSNVVYRGEKKSDNTSLWIVATDKITNVESTTRRLQYNTSSPRFACYTGSQKDVTLYVNEASLLPALAKPATLLASAEGSTVTVVWNAVENAESYDVTCAGQTKNVTGTDAKFADVAVGTYEVSVVAKASGFNSSKAATTSVVVGTPTLDKPVIKSFSETATGFTVELEKAVDYATSYDWYLYEGVVDEANCVGIGTSDSANFTTTFNESEFSITEFAPKTTYYLVIIAKAAAYTSSESEPASFTTAGSTGGGTSYEIVFLTNTSDGSNEIGSSTEVSTVVELIDSRYYITSFTSNCSKAYYKCISGVKLGSSKAAGTLEFYLADEVKSNVVSIKVETAKYGTDTGTITMYNGTTKLKSGIAPADGYTHTFDTPTTVESLKFVTSSKRAYISKITITVSGN